MDHKTVVAPVELKQGDGVPEGTVRSQIATVSVVDKDGDLTEPGAFGKQGPLLISAWNHSSARSFDTELPVGAGLVFEEGKAAIFEGRYNLETEAGRDSYHTLKFNVEAGVATEWSYAFDVVEAGEREVDGQSVRILKDLRLFEVSPVIRGAGEGTATLAIKGATSFGNLALAPRRRAWDAGAARGRLRTWASSDGSGEKDTITWSKYRKGFLWYDSDDAEDFGAYKLPFADLIGGDLKAVPRGVFAAAAVLQGGRGGARITSPDAVKAHVGRYYAKMRREFEDDSIIPPWDKADGTTLQTHSETVLATVEEYGERVRSLVDLRAQKGERISPAVTEVIDDMVKALDGLKTLAARQPEDQSDLVVADIARYQAIVARIDAPV